MSIIIKTLSAILLSVIIYGCCAAISTSSKEEVENKAEEAIQKTVEQNTEINLETAKHEDVDWSIGCQDCHSDVTPDIFAEWEASRHGQIGFGCYICHGDGDENFYPLASTNECQSCHDDHLEFCGIEAKDKSCFDCHDGHTLELYVSKGGK